MSQKQENTNQSSTIIEGIYYLSIDDEEILIQLKGKRDSESRLRKEDDIKEHDVSRVVNIVRQFYKGIALSNVPYNTGKGFVIKGIVVLIGCRTESVV